jgi:hypothetical protein
MVGLATQAAGGQRRRSASAVDATWDPPWPRALSLCVVVVVRVDAQFRPAGHRERIEPGNPGRSRGEHKGRRRMGWVAGSKSREGRGVANTYCC